MQFMTAEKAYLSQGYCDPKRKWQGGGGVTMHFSFIWGQNAIHVLY